MEGFDHDASNLDQKWDSTSGSNATTGRFPGSLAASVLNISFGLTQGQLAPVPTRTVGFALRPGSQFIGNGTALLQFFDGVTEQVSVRWGANGTLLVTRNGTVLATSSQVLLASTWVYLEFQATIDASAGAYTLRITTGGVTTVWLTATGVNTRSTANSTTDGIRIFGGATFAALQFSIDDLYVLNSSGSVNNGFLGECRIFTNTPNADGTTKQWTPSTGTAHWSLVDEMPPTDDTDSVSSATPGQIDTYRFAAINPSGAIAGVQVTLSERKDDVGSRTTCVEYRSGSGTSFDGSNQFSPGSSYKMDRQIYESDPATGAAWTVSNINAAEFGVKCIA